MKLQALRQKALCSLRRRGLWGTLRHLVQLLLTPASAYISRQWRRCGEWKFDHRFGVDTGGLVAQPEAPPDSPYHYASRYQATPPKLFHQMMSALNIDHRQFIFVDIGCGKGRVLLLAARFPFKKIIGVELSPDLLSIAEKNLGAYRSTARGSPDYQLLRADAASWPIPGEPAVLYFYHPFTEEIMARLLQNLHRSLAECPRDVYVIYCNPVLERLLAGVGSLQPVAKTTQYSIYSSLRK